MCHTLNNRERTPSVVEFSFQFGGDRQIINMKTNKIILCDVRYYPAIKKKSEKCCFSEGKEHRIRSYSPPQDLLTIKS